MRKKKAFNKIIQFSVDTLNVDLKNELNLKGKKILGRVIINIMKDSNEPDADNGKIVVDKIFSIIFLICFHQFY